MLRISDLKWDGVYCKSCGQEGTACCCSDAEREEAEDKYEADLEAAVLAAESMAQALEHLRGLYDCGDVADPALAAYREHVSDA